MHEVGMAFDIAQMVDAYAESHGIGNVAVVNLVVGEYAGVIVEELRLGFDAACARSRHCASCTLAVKRVEGRVRCRACGEAFHLVEPGAPCPCCGGHDREYIVGKELNVASIEYDA